MTTLEKIEAIQKSTQDAWQIMQEINDLHIALGRIQGWALSLVEDEHLPVNMKEKFVTIANAASILNEANNSI